MHENRSRPWPTPGQRIRLCKMRSHRRSCKAWVFATSQVRPENAKRRSFGRLLCFDHPLLSDYPDRSFVTAVRFIVNNTPGLGSSRTEMTVRAGLRSPMIST